MDEYRYDTTTGDILRMYFVRYTLDNNDQLHKRQVCSSSSSSSIVRTIHNNTNPIDQLYIYILDT